MSTFPIVEVLDRIEVAVTPYPKAAMYELAREGWTTPFQQLVSCLISVRTFEETTLPVCRRLFAVASTPATVAALSEPEILALIRASTFSDRKAGQIRQIALRVRDEFHGELPCDETTMRSFHGIGVKCANLALGIACGQARVSVDIHVHRVTNRWGYVATKTPEQTTIALEAAMPEDQKVRINRLLVPFGKHICTGTRPRCSTCPVLDRCAQVGVTSQC